MRAPSPCPASPLLIVVLAALVAAAPAGGQSEGTLRDRIGSGKARERSLASAAARLGQLERKVAREVAVLEGRLARGPERARRRRRHARRDPGRLVEARRRVNRLRERLAEVRVKLARAAARALHGRPPGLRHRRPARRRLPAAARDADVRAPRRARRHARCSGSSAPPARTPTASARATGALARAPRARGRRGARPPRRARRRSPRACASGARCSPAPTPPGSPRSAAPARPPQAPSASSSRLLAARARAAVSRRARAARGRSRGRSCSASPAARTCRPTTPAPPATTSSCSDLEGPRRLDPARLPGLQGRAGPARGAPVGRRRGRHNWVCAEPRRRLISRTGRRACSTRSRWPPRLSTRTATRACSRSPSRASATLVSAIDASPSAARPPASHGCGPPARALTVDRYDADWTSSPGSSCWDVTIEPVDRGARRAAARYPAYRDSRRPDRSWLRRAGSQWRASG